ncbi:hypothetical protein CHRYSEOSP005_00610 [Chryseobacterium sp. Alg-005]|uniref:hypothetical protein n=1 Tax=Chryseobacterium sp. Alg-005 TaxID=3159516 RepID=UPI003555B91C
MTNIVKESYKEPILNISISENELENYENAISEKMPIFSSNPFIDGVYTDYESFAQQKPDKELVVKKNKNGEIKGVKRIDDYDNFKAIFAVVDNGIAYKRTPTSLIEVEKDNDGYFIIASEEEIFPQQNTSTIVGAATGGAIGGIVGAVMDVVAAKIRRQNATYHRVGIDKLTGEYILPEGFRKYK